ncbi:HXXEE domain-containing protein [Psychrobacillus sp. FSL K6-1267]|uniref:HXXEE domain-containing protein n=1 Tax=Psychrobacillus sp. FSL K6-1267 TaxID=2921543 RepID=UPI0030F87254
MEDIKIKKLLWMFPIVFLLHDVEEILTVEKFILPLPFQVTEEEFALAFSLLWVIVTVGCLVTAANKRFLGMALSSFLMLMVGGIFLANGIGHVLQGIFFQRYVPGLITAVILLIPFCVYSIRVLLITKMIKGKQLPLYIMLGFILQTPFAFTALLIAKYLLS